MTDIRPTICGVSMVEQRRLGTSDFLLFMLVFILAVFVRFGYLYVCTDGGRNSGPFQVQDSPHVLALPPETEMAGHTSPNDLDGLAHNLNENRWFGDLAPLALAEERTAHMAPAYPWLLSWLESFPLGLGSGERAMRFVQALVGALTAALYFLFLVRALNSSFLATIGGFLCAVYPPWVIAVAEIQDGVITSFFLALAITCGAVAGGAGGPLTSLLHGITLAGLSLLRAAMLPFALVTLAWFLFRCRNVRQGWTCGLLAFLGFTMGTAFWTYRNFTLFHDVVPIADSAYWHLWMGNNPASTGGTLSERSMLTELAKVREQEPQALLEELGALPQKQRYDALAGAVWDQVRFRPAATLRRRIAAAECFLLGEDWSKGRTLVRRRPVEPDSVSPRVLALMPALIPCFLVLLYVFAFLGWRWSFGSAQALAPSSLAIIWVPLPYILSHAASLHGPRLPLDGILLCYAAFAMASLLMPGQSGLLGDTRLRS